MRPANSGLLKRVALRALVHTYTRTPMTDGTVDSEGNAPQTPGAPVTGLACLFEMVERVTVAPDGRTSLSTPTIRIAPASPLQNDDRVTDIRDRNGTLLNAGPLWVDEINPYAGVGESVMKVATLRGAKIRAAG